MGENHKIIGPPQGEPLTADRKGARVRIPLGSPPSPRWSRAFAGRLMTELVGCPAVAHLRLDQVVQGTHIVLDGVESAEAERLGPAVQAAIDAANQACGQPKPGDDRPANMDQAAADQVARAVGTEAAATVPAQAVTT